MNQWFFETFLPSLFDRAGANHRMWLSRKQTAVCVENMNRHTVRYEVLQGFESRSYFITEWNGRTVTLFYSKKNGCGQIEFSATKEEVEEAREKSRIENERIERERIRRRKERNPEKFAEEVRKLRDTISSYEDDLQLDLEENPDFVEEDRRCIAYYQSELDKLLSV